MPAACLVKVRKTAGRILKFIPERERPHYLPWVYTLGTRDTRDSAWLMTEKDPKSIYNIREKQKGNRK